MARLEPKTAAETRNYTFDWSTFLGEDTIATSDVAVSGVTLVSDSNTADSVTVKVSGGTEGSVAQITSTITTTGGLTETEVFTLAIYGGEPVSLAEAKEHLRVTDDSEDRLIAALLVSAREYVENYTGHVLVRREFTETFTRFPAYLELTKRPIVAETIAIAYVDTDGAEQVVASFVETTGRYPYRVYPAYNAWWPSIRTNTLVTVTFTAGYAPGEEPQALLQAILIKLEILIDRGKSDPAVTKAREEAVFSLCNQYRAPVL